MTMSGPYLAGGGGGGGGGQPINRNTRCKMAAKQVRLLSPRVRMRALISGGRKGKIRLVSMSWRNLTAVADILHAGFTNYMSLQSFIV